jgi:CDP-4-dehydro-6-deoxyglucose reductase
MGERLAVSKAANLLGISRHELQQLIRRGDLHTFEGKVDLDELHHCYPLMVLEEDQMLERVRLIRKTAFGRRVKERVLPDTDDLDKKLRRKTAEADIAREQMVHYRTILEELSKLLEQIRWEGGNEMNCTTVERINHWLLDRLKS